MSPPARPLVGKPRTLRKGTDPWAPWRLAGAGLFGVLALPVTAAFVEALLGFGDPFVLPLLTAYAVACGGALGVATLRLRPRAGSRRRDAVRSRTRVVFALVGTLLLAVWGLDCLFSIEWMFEQGGDVSAWLMVDADDRIGWLLAGVAGWLAAFGAR